MSVSIGQQSGEGVGLVLWDWSLVEMPRQAGGHATPAGLDIRFAPKRARRLAQTSGRLLYFNEQL